MGIKMFLCKYCSVDNNHDEVTLLSVIETIVLACGIFVIGVTCISLMLCTVYAILATSINDEMVFFAILGSCLWGVIGLLIYMKIEVWLSKVVLYKCPRSKE